MPEPESELVELVERSLAAGTREKFDDRVDEQAETLREAIRAGRFDNERFTVGLELEAYAVDDGGRLARVPESVFETPGCKPELGRHNVEITTPPDAFDAGGLAAQAERLRERVAEARRALDGTGRELVLDAMWTVPPAEGAGAYLSAVDVDDESGVTAAANMRPDPRYCAIDNDVLARAGGAVALDLPGVTREFPTILVESLTASIQPHLQVPDVDAFPAYHGVALRTLGPVLALATNSPFLPADFYGDVDVDEDENENGDGSGDGTGPAPADVVEGTHHELRVPVFEQAINAWDEPKVRFPRDIDRTVDVVDRLVSDRTCAPFLREWVTDGDGDGLVDRIWELDHKRGTYWRWLRAVIGGDPAPGVDERSIRIEYRPLPTQPTVTDTVALQRFVAGLVHGLVVADHPAADLEWDAARRCFYDVVEAGLDARLAWVDADGRRTDDPADVYGELFEHARLGLREQGLAPETIDESLAPIEARWREARTPSRWKKAAVRERLDRGADLRAAVEGMQRAYVERCRSGEPFAEW